jgi:hypothetical protein
MKAQPVVHFEVIGRDPALLRDYFSQLFGWDFATPSPVAEEVSASNDYGFLDLIATDDGTGIRGGVGGGPGSASQMLKLLCNEQKNLAVLGSWDQSHHPTD